MGQPAQRICLGNRPAHVTQPRFPPPPNRMPRPPWRSRECRTRSARLHKLAGAAPTVAVAAAVVATAAAITTVVPVARRLAAAPCRRTHHLAATPAAAAFAAVASAAFAAAHLLSCLSHHANSILLSLSLAIPLATPTRCLHFRSSRSLKRRSVHPEQRARGAAALQSQHVPD